MTAGTKTTQIEAPDNKSLPNSRRVYVNGKLPGVRVPFREITQSASRELDGNLVANPPIRVYDTSGPWCSRHSTDPRDDWKTPPGCSGSRGRASS